MEGERAKEREGGSGTSGEGGREEVSLPLSVPPSLSIALSPSLPLSQNVGRGEVAPAEREEARRNGAGQRRRSTARIRFACAVTTALEGCSS